MLVPFMLFVSLCHAGKDTENLSADKSGLTKNAYLCRRNKKEPTVEVTYLISDNREYRFFCYVRYR